ncbi:hypothetical protein L2E82_25450 [Cichorium intybus]|uniref:Uncharacterized protein n=1 Tax=Cichorium intybus TaxID=13427 RepID=A0ACB9E324_CICIN|nr:hypothetical protein L2E82_25450 [Cichorium intybus]
MTHRTQSHTIVSYSTHRQSSLLLVAKGRAFIVHVSPPGKAPAIATTRWRWISGLQGPLVRLAFAPYHADIPDLSKLLSKYPSMAFIHMNYYTFWIKLIVDHETDTRLITTFHDISYLEKFYQGFST